MNGCGQVLPEQLHSVSGAASGRYNCRPGWKERLTPYTAPHPSGVSKEAPAFVWDGQSGLGVNVTEE